MKLRLIVSLASLFLPVDASLYRRECFLEQCRIVDGQRHLLEAAGRYDKRKFIGRNQRAGRRVEQPDEATAASFPVFLHCKGDYAATPRCEACDDGIVTVVIIECP